jgi:hypothetical protein
VLVRLFSWGKLAILRTFLRINVVRTIERRWVDEHGNYVSYRLCTWVDDPPPGTGIGKTTWYFAKSNTNTSSPPAVPQAKTGHLYVHLDCSTHTHQYWMFGANNEWQSVSKGSEHPLNHDRVLSIRGNGEPSWVTRDRASISTTQGR